MKLSLSSVTTNRRFVKALRRQVKWTDLLKELLRREDLPRNDVTLIVAFVDETPGFVRVMSNTQSLIDVEVGYDYSGDYKPGDDVLALQLVEECVVRAIDATEFSTEEKASLSRVVEDWATQAVMP